MALFNDQNQNMQRQAVGVGGPYGPPQNGGINPGGMYGGGGMTGSGPYDPYGKPGGISGAQPPGGPYGKPGNTGPMPPTPGGPKRPFEDPGVYWGPSQTDPNGGGTIFGNPGAKMFGGGGSVWANNNNPNSMPGSGNWVDPSIAARLGGGAMPPPNDLPPPRFPTPGNTGPIPPAPGPQRPIDPRNAPITPPPPPNGDGWGPARPEGGPPPIEDPHGQFPMRPMRPQNPWGAGQQRPRPVRQRDSALFSPPAPQAQPQGGGSGTGNGAMNAYLKSF